VGREVWLSGERGAAAMNLAGSAVGTSAACDGLTVSERRVLDLFESLRKPLMRYLLWMRIDADRSEDMVQETFFRLHEHLKHDRLSDDNCRGWIWKVAHNLALRQLQMETRERSFVRLDLGSQPVTVLRDPRPNPEETASFDQKRRRILSALGELGEREQQCLHLRAEGLGYREIAEILGIGRSTVADTLRRAIARMQKVIHE